MAIFHRAMTTPTKGEIIERWAPTRQWGPSAGDDIELIGSDRFDDPDGRVGMETFLASAGGTLFQVPLTYRDEPLEDGGSALITRCSTRCSAPAGCTTACSTPATSSCSRANGTGRGARHGRVRRSLVHRSEQLRIHGGGWTVERVPVDGFQLVSDEPRGSVLRNDRFELAFYRRPVASGRPPIGLTATWDAAGGPVVLAEVRER